ncbi:MAG TPA: hypothetical protein VII92_13505, partial [Anaerolineae bacterium]
MAFLFVCISPLFSGNAIRLSNVMTKRRTAAICYQRHDQPGGVRHSAAVSGEVPSGQAELRMAKKGLVWHGQHSD